MNQWGWFSSLIVVLVFGAVACGDDGSSSPSDELMDVDAEGPTACVNDLGCSGTQRCPTCTCECEPFELVWERDDLGPVMHVAASGDKTYVLLGAAPYVAVLDADGESLAMDELDLSWVANAQNVRIHAAPDGSILVLGIVAPISGAQLHIERWSESGEKLFVDTFAGSYDVAAMSADGTLLLADRETISTFDENNTFTPTEVVAGYDHPQRLVGQEARVAVSTAGSTVWVETSSGSYLYGHDLQGRPRGDAVRTASGQTCALSVDAEGFAAVGCMDTEQTLTMSVARYSPEQTLLWQADRVGRLANGINSVITAATSSSLISALATNTTLRVDRVTTAGVLVGGHTYSGGVAQVGGVGAVAPAEGDEFFVVLAPYYTAGGVATGGAAELKRLRVTPLEHGSREEGEACGEAEDCASDVCCTALGGGSTCGAAEGCPAGSACTSDEECETGAACTRALGWPGPGVCWSSCTDDCEAGFVCSAPPGAGPERACLPDCLAEGAAACSDLTSHACVDVTDADGFEARACVGQEDPSSSDECTFDDDCAAGDRCDGGQCVPDDSSCEACTPTGSACNADAECASGNCCFDGSVAQCSDASCERTVPGTLCEHDLECETLMCQSDGLCAPRGGAFGEPCTTPADCSSFVCCLGACAESGDCFGGDFGTPCLGSTECLSALECRGADPATSTLGYCSRDCFVDSTCELALGTAVPAVCVVPPSAPDEGFCAPTCASDLDCESSRAQCLMPAGAPSLVCVLP